MSATDSTRPTHLALKVSLRVYSLDSVKRAAYKFADKVAVLIGAPDPEESVVLEFTGLKNQDVDLVQCRSEFLVELGDQDLRERIAQETAPLRNAIIAHAFSRSSLVAQD